MQFRGMWLLTAVIMASRLLVIMMAVAFLDSILSSSIKATFQ